VRGKKGRISPWLFLFSPPGHKGKREESTFSSVPLKGVEGGRCTAACAVPLCFPSVLLSPQSLMNRRRPLAPSFPSFFPPFFSYSLSFSGNFLSERRQQWGGGEGRGIKAQPFFSPFSFFFFPFFLIAPPLSVFFPLWIYEIPTTGYREKNVSGPCSPPLLFSSFSHFPGPSLCAG